MQGQGGHVVSKDDLFRGRSIVEVCHGTMSSVQDRVGGNAGRKCAFMVGIAFNKIAVDTVEGLFGDLSPAGVVEKNSRAIKRRELLTDEVAVEGHGVSLLAIFSASINSSGVLTFQNASPDGS